MTELRAKFLKYAIIESVYLKIVKYRKGRSVSCELSSECRQTDGWCIPLYFRS